MGKTKFKIKRVERAHGTSSGLTLPKFLKAEQMMFPTVLLEECDWNWTQVIIKLQQI